MQNSNRPRRLVKPFGAAAGSGYIRQVPVAAQPDGAASYDEGFPPETFQPVGSGGVPPSGADMNGVLFDATGNAMAYAAGMPAMFDGAYAAAIGGYPKYAVLAGVTPGTLYQSSVENNTTDPDSGGSSGWSIVTTAGDSGPNYERRASGILEQWGTVAASSSGGPVIPVTLPIEHVDGSYVIMLTGFINGPSQVRDTFPQTIQSTINTTGFSVQYQNAGAGSTSGLDGFTWRTIGR